MPEAPGSPALSSEVTNKRCYFAFSEREERRREKTKKKETLWEPKMDETFEETLLFTENIWLPQNQTNVSSQQFNILYHFYDEPVALALAFEKFSMAM